MATIDSRQIIDQIIARNGRPEEDDPPGTVVMKIIEYTNMEGGTTWGIVFASEASNPATWMRYEEETRYVRRPKVIWRRQLTVGKGL